MIIEKRSKNARLLVGLELGLWELSADVRPLELPTFFFRLKESNPGLQEPSRLLSLVAIGPPPPQPNIVLMFCF